MNISLIAAIGKNNELGKNNTLIWSFKEDMKFFKDTTMGYPVVMGTNTFDSLPFVLPGRKNIVISPFEINNDNIEIYNSIESFLEAYKDFKEEIFIIGGASIYKQFIDYANKLYLTEIDATDKEAEVFFPEFNRNEFDKEIISEYVENNITYKHVLYKRKNVVEK